MIMFASMPFDFSGMHRRHTPSRRSGFTLVEMMVSVVILVVLMLIISQITQMTSQAWKQTTQSTGTMQQARVAFERMTRTLSQATLNTYYCYQYANGPGTQPTAYSRQSELQFLSGYGPVAGTTFISNAVGSAAQVTHAVFFQAPLGITSSSNATNYANLNSLLNACGYFVMYGQDTFRPSFFNTAGLANAPPNESRYRLMEFLQPSEYLSIYTANGMPSSAGTVPAWLSLGFPNLTTTQGSPVTVRPLVNNIVALIIMPEQFTSGTTSNGEANTAPLNSPATSPTPGFPAQTATTYNYDSAYNAQGVVNDTAGNSHQNPTGHQLPPMVKVVMVAIDEASATRLAAKYPSATSASPPDLGNLSTSSPALFQDPRKLFTSGGVTGDLQTFENTLTGLKLNYYVFQTDVVIRSAKWTSQ